MELAEDVWIDIFVRLRVRSLMVAICVCKRWYSLIKSYNENEATKSYFTRKNLEYQEKIMLLQHHHVTLDPECSELNCVLFDTNYSSSNKLDGGGLLLQISLQDHKRLRIDGPVNGLYCLYENDKRERTGIIGPVIWNPATNEAAFLPPPHQFIPDWSWDPPRTSYSLYYHWLGIDVVGFGNHGADYKVILVCHSETNWGDRGHYILLYTTATNTWTLFGEEETDLVIEEEGGAVWICALAPSLNNTFLNGFYYWKKSRAGIVFDMTDDVFREISTPCDYGSFALHHDHIYLFHLDQRQNEINIWMMLEESDNNNDTNWIKKISVSGIQVPVEKLLGFWKTENELILVTKDKQTVFYNIATREITNLVWPKGLYPCDVRASDYKESLVSLSGGIIKYKGTECAPLSDKFQSHFRFCKC